MAFELADATQDRNLVTNAVKNIGDGGQGSIRDDVISSQEPVQRADRVDVHMFLDVFPKLVMCICRAGKEEIIHTT